jgi:hypothetical protein
VTKEPTDAEFFQGRDAYFADPEGNYWEIAWAPDTDPVVAAARRAASQPPPKTRVGSFSAQRTPDYAAGGS